MGYQSFKELNVWQESKNLSIKIYKLTSEGNFSKDFSLKDQIRRASISIVSNIAEGYERNSDKDFIRFLLISKGSLSELRTQLEISMEIGYIDQDSYNQIESQTQKIGKMLTNLIKFHQPH